MTGIIHAVVADDHPLFRDGVVRTLQEADDIEVVGQADTAESAVETVAATLPDIVLLDISMPGNGLEAADRIGKQYPAVKILMLTVSEQDADVLRAIRCGASGYVLKGVTSDDLLAVVRSICAGNTYISPVVAGRVLAEMTGARGRSRRLRDPISDLTAREEQILRLVAKGESNRAIADTLDLREATVKHYMTNILQKLHVRNRVEAALLAREKGF